MLTAIPEKVLLIHNTGVRNRFILFLLYKNYKIIIFIIYFRLQLITETILNFFKIFMLNLLQKLKNVKK
jgi:hypothetical protein